MKILKYFPLIVLSILLIYSINGFCNVKAIQLSYIKCLNYDELDKEFKKIKSKGFNTVIFRVFNNPKDRIYPFIPVKKLKHKSGVYFKTKHCPVVYNLLPSIAALCHKNNLKIIAWLTTRYLDFNIKDKDRMVYKFDFNKDEIVPTKGLSFFNKKNLEYISSIYIDLLKNNIDGVLLQDDLKIKIDEDFNINALKIYYKKNKVKLCSKNIKKLLFKNAKKRYLIKNNKELEKWNDFKSAQINKFINFLVQQCKKHKKIKFFMNINYETLYRPKLSKLWYSYNLDTLKDSNIDYFVVMLYQNQIKKELKLSEKATYQLIYKIVQNSSKLIDKNKVVFKIQVFDWYKNKPIKKNYINKLFTFFYNHNIENIAIFPYRKNLTIFK